MKYIDIESVVIPDIFSKSHPKEEKLQAIRDYYRVNNRLDRPLVLTSDYVLTDNYLRYLIAKEFGVQSVAYVLTYEVSDKQEYRSQENSNRTITYIVGKFYKCDKEYVWQNPKDIPVKIGDCALVKSMDKKRKKNTVAVVTVTNIFKSNNPALKRHKSIIKVFKNINNKTKG